MLHPFFIVLVLDLRNLYESVFQWILTCFFACISGSNNNIEVYFIIVHLQKPGGVIALLDEAWYV
jgi:hypothetical protein